MTDFLLGHTHALFWAFLVLCLTWFYLHHKKPLRAFLLGGSTGLASLILLHCFGGAIGFAPELNLTDLAVAIFLGVPGTGLLWAAQFFGG